MPSISQWHGDSELLTNLMAFLGQEVNRSNCRASVEVLASIKLSGSAKARKTEWLCWSQEKTKYRKTFTFKIFQRPTLNNLDAFAKSWFQDTDTLPKLHLPANPRFLLRFEKSGFFELLSEKNEVQTVRLSSCSGSFSIATHWVEKPFERNIFWCPVNMFSMTSWMHIDMPWMVVEISRNCSKFL